MTPNWILCLAGVDLLGFFILALSIATAVPEEEVRDCAGRKATRKPTPAMISSTYAGALR